MNKVMLTGRLTRDPEVRRDGEDKAVARFTIAVDRRGNKEGADFPTCVAFNKTADFVEKYFVKGKPIEIVGRLQTGSYTNKDGVKVYTTDVVVDEVNFVLRDGDSKEPTSPDDRNPDSPIDGFAKLSEDDIPF